MVILFIFVVAVIAIIWFLLPKPTGRQTAAKATVMNSNPIDGICFGGVLGFMLGDSYAFCKSRFKHLNLTINEDDFESIAYKRGISSSRNQYVICGRNEYNNVNEIAFCFQGKTLSSISLDIDYSKEGKENMYGILVSRLSRVLGKEPFLCTNKFSKWSSSKGSVVLSIYHEDYIKNVSDKVLIQILY